MKRLMMRGAIVASMLAVVAPVAAQPMGGWNRDAFWRGAPAGPAERIDFLQQRIDRGMRDGSLNRREARRAQGELFRIRQMARTMRDRDGGMLNPTDRSYIQERLDNLSRTIRWQRHNRW